MVCKERSVATDADDGEERGREGKAQEKQRPFQTEGEDQQATGERKLGRAGKGEMGRGLVPDRPITTPQCHWAYHSKHDV